MSEPLCVTMIMRSYAPRIGGAERQVATLAPLLQAYDISVHVLTRRYPGMSTYEVIDGVPVYRINVPSPKPIGLSLFTSSILEFVQRLRPNIIHAHELFSPTVAAIITKVRFGIPVVATPHLTGVNGDIEKLKRKMLGQQWIALYKKQVDRFIGINPEIDADMASVGIPVEKRVLIPNGVSTRHFVPLDPFEKKSLRISLGLTANAPVVTFVGRLVSSKRVDLLISIWNDVRTVHPHAQLLIVGNGPEETVLKQAAGAGIQFIGAVQNVLPYLQVADLFVLPSSEEGLSVALLEAMATELPVIATQVGGNPGLVQHGETGWLVPPNDAAVLRTAVLSLVSDADCRTKLGHAARQHVIANYDLESSARQLVELYSQLAYNEKIEQGSHRENAFEAQA